MRNEVPVMWLVGGGLINHSTRELHPMRALRGQADYGDGLYMDVDSDGDMRAVAPRPVLTFLAQGGYAVSIAKQDHRI